MKTLLTFAVAIVLATSAHAQSQLLQLSPVESEVAEFARDLDANAYYFGFAVVQINRTWNKQWGKPTHQLEAFLNALGAQKLAQFIALQAATAQQINSLLDATATPGPRVNATPGREFTVDPATGYITVVPLIDPVTGEAVQETGDGGQGTGQ